MEQSVNGRLTVDQRLERIEVMLTEMYAPTRRIPDLISIAADSFDEAMQSETAEKLDVEARLKHGLELLVKLSDPEVISLLKAVLDTADKLPGLISIAADSLDEAMAHSEFELHTMTQSVALLMNAGQEAAHEPIKPVSGVFNLLGRLRNEDTARALGYLFNFLNALGKNLKDKS